MHSKSKPSPVRKILDNAVYTITDALKVFFLFLMKISQNRVSVLVGPTGVAELQRLSRSVCEVTHNDIHKTSNN